MRATEDVGTAVQDPCEHGASGVGRAASVAGAGRAAAARFALVKAMVVECDQRKINNQPRDITQAGSRGATPKSGFRFVEARALHYCCRYDVQQVITMLATVLKSFEYRQRWFECFLAVLEITSSERPTLCLSKVWLEFGFR